MLLHICCGPCAIWPLLRLREQGIGVTGFFYNPNIHPLQEYLRRRQALADLAHIMAFDVIWGDIGYDPAVFFHAVHRREDNRCFHCYALRLEKTRDAAQHLAFDAFSSTLLYSRYQQHETIADVGAMLANSLHGPSFHYEDFRVGWKKGIIRSKELGLYRQPYCGCLYSEFERYHKALEAVAAQPVVQRARTDEPET